MKLSEYTIKELIPYVQGDIITMDYRKGADLVDLFNRVGFRDIYDFNAGGLPSIYQGQTSNTSRKEYTRNRLRLINGKEELRNLISIIISESSNISRLSTDIDKIISHDGYKVSIIDGRINILGGIIQKDTSITNNVLFSQYEAKLLQELENAKISIVAAVAWISNEKLVDKLKDKHKQGVDVKIIINQDGINKKHCPDFEGITVYAKRGEHGGIMHNKFCVIDNQVVIHGSYNWSTNAEFKNDETMEIVKGDNELASSFSIQFRSLLKKSHLFKNSSKEA